MLNIWMKKLKSLWKFLVKYWLLILIIVGTVMGISDCKSRENLEKFLSINVDMKAAGIHTEELIAKLKKDPLGTRVRVENHKRKRFILITKEQEKAMGEQFVSKMKSLDILWENSAAVERCNKILKRLTKVLPKNSHINEKIYILNTKYINAFCLPDGTITITKGALKEFDDDELAYLLAHELGHGIAHHYAEMLSKSIIQTLAIDALIDKDSKSLSMVGADIVRFMANLAYSRTQENEADRLGLLLVNKAKFNITGAISVLNKFQEEAGENSKWKEWLSTHPHPENRLKNVKKAIAELKNNPDHIWGSPNDDSVEEKKVKAIKYYLHINKLVTITENINSLIKKK